MRYVYINFQDGGGFRDITHLVKFDTLTITTRAFSDNWHYAQNEASFTVIYDPIIYEKFQTISKEAVVRIFEEASAHLTTELLANLLTEDGFYLMTELDFISPVFYGRVPPTKSRRYNGKIDITMFNVEALDELSLLKKKVGDTCYRNFYIMNPNDKANSIVHQLAYRAGLIDAQINNMEILDQVEAFAPPSEDDLILDVLDALLFEYGYALNMNTAGQIEPIQWMRSGQPVTHVFNETNIINEVSIVDSLKQYDGAEVIYYELGEAVTTSGNVNMLLYQDSNLPYDGQGNFAGYPIPGGFKYPPRTNVIDEATGSGQIVYQEYDDKALKYWTNEAIVKRLDYNYKAFESDYSGIVATSGWTLDYRADTGVNLIKAVFENRRAEVVFENTTSGFANLYYMNIYGRVLYKTRERKARIENFEGATEIDQYVSTFLFDKQYADRLAKYLAAQHDVGNTYYQFQSEDQELPGQLVQIVLNEGTNVDGMILEQQYDEKTMLFTYKVRQYTRASLPALTYQEVKEVPNVTANLVAQNITGSSGNPVPAISAKYLGRYEASHPVSNNGDWWVVYDTDDDPIQRGVWYNNNGTPERITVSSSSTLQAKFVEALTDVAWAEAGGYGVAADYGIQTLFQSLGVVTAFIQNLFAQEIQATGKITGATLRTVDGYCSMDDQAGDEDGYKGITVSSQPINESSPGGTVLQMVNLYNILTGRVPSLYWKSWINGAWVGTMSFSTNGGAALWQNNYTGLFIQLGTDGHMTVTKRTTPYNNETKAIIKADEFSGVHYGTRKLFPNAFFGNYIHGQYTQADIFDKLAPSIPNAGATTGDEIVVTGGFPSMTISRAKRTSATQITFYGVGATQVGSITITAGSTATLTLSISW